MSRPELFVQHVQLGAGNDVDVNARPAGNSEHVAGLVHPAQVGAFFYLAGGTQVVMSFTPRAACELAQALLAAVDRLAKGGDPAAKAALFNADKPAEAVSP